MNEINLIDLSEIALPNWLPNNYVQAVADAIVNTGFVPPIIFLDDELLTPDVVAALRTIKARNELPGAVVGVVPMGIAVRDGHWLVSVDRRMSKVEVNSHNYFPTTYIVSDWYRHVRPAGIWRDAYWTYNNSHSSGGIGGVNAISASWSADQPTLASGTARLSVDYADEIHDAIDGRTSFAVSSGSSSS